ncbi:MAG: DUF3343 domain-containing protein [Dehalococcoidales bacterium]|nr:DUF3343 domain-containing protein [Dehalococcoidales bacterium]
MEKKSVAFKGDGIIIFKDVSQAITAEKVIKGAGYEIKLIAPPPELRMGCDLALEINLVERPGIERLLKEKDAYYVNIFPLMKGTAPLCEIIKITDYGQWTMVKAGNMKMAFDKDRGIIVNISGGGCPDIPYLHAEMVDKKLTEAPRPKELGYTLCAVMLDLALEECLNLWKGSKS